MYKRAEMDYTGLHWTELDLSRIIGQDCTVKDRTRKAGQDKTGQDPI